MEPQPLLNPPIIEAMIEFVVAPSEGDATSKLDALRAELLTRFPIQQRRDEFQVQLALGQGAPLAASTVQQRPHAFLFFSRSQDRAVQVSPLRFAFSQLRSYQGWGALSEETATLWAQYARAISPRRVTAVAVRYINRLELPLGGAPPSEFLSLFPHVPEGLPPIARSLMQVTMPDPVTGSVALVTQTVEPIATAEGAFAVGLDIQARADVDLAVEDPALWLKLDALRLLKNQIFFASVTDRALEHHR